MDLYHFVAMKMRATPFCSCMQVINVLSDEKEITTTFRELHDCGVRCIGLGRTNRLAPFPVPLPNQFRIAHERGWRGQLRRVKFAPVAFGAAECRDTALGRYASSGNDKNAGIGGKHAVS
ncbi:MAG: hypothetical protein QOI34_793 [Verrucomicrobiota bacterium]